MRSARRLEVSSRRLALFTVTAGFASMLLGANLAAPLYAGYAEQYHFSTAVLALIFAVCALVLIPSLLVFGQVSDQLGRRPVIAMGLGLAIGGLALFAAAQGMAWLFAARAVQGLAQGMLGGAATAALAELVDEGDVRRAALLATLAQAGGAATGAALSGVLAPMGTRAAGVAVRGRPRSGLTSSGSVSLPRRCGPSPADCSCRSSRPTRVGSCCTRRTWR